MRRFPDYKNMAQVFLPDSVHEMVDIAVATASPQVRLPDYSGTWLGREFEGWADVADKFNRPWKEGLELVHQMMDKVKQHVTMTPQDLRRKMKYNDYEGAIDIDRAMSGESEIYRKAKRQMRVSTRNVALLANIGNVGSYRASEMFWRGIAACVIIDILEEAGYQCELWIYNTAHNAFRSSPSKAFIATKVKATEDPLNLDLVCNCLSAWFHRAIVFGFRASIAGYSIGGCSSRPELGELREHIDLVQGIQTVPVSATAYSEVAAVIAVNKALETVAAGQGEKGEDIYADW